MDTVWCVYEDWGYGGRTQRAVISNEVEARAYAEHLVAGRDPETVEMVVEEWVVRDAAVACIEEEARVVEEQRQRYQEKMAKPGTA